MQKVVSQFRRFLKCLADASGKCMDGDGEEFEMTAESSDLDGDDCQWRLRNAMWASWSATPKRIRDENISPTPLCSTRYATCLCKDCFPKWTEEFVINKRVNTMGV